MAQASPATERMAPLLRAARAVQDWSLVDVAKRTGLSVSTIYAAEGRGRRSPTDMDVDSLRALFRNEGIEFLDDEANGLGIKIDQP